MRQVRRYVRALFAGSLLSSGLTVMTFAGVSALIEGAASASQSSLFASTTAGFVSNAAAVPTNVCYVEATAIGGAGSAPFDGFGGGPGASVTARVPVTPGEQLSVAVGGSGGPTDPNSPAGGNGGFGGGGGGGEDGGGGGGASVVSGAGNVPLIVAGGGGGGSATSAGGAGGTTEGNGAPSDGGGGVAPSSTLPNGGDGLVGGGGDGGAGGTGTGAGGAPTTFVIHVGGDLGDLTFSTGTGGAGDSTGGNGGITGGGGGIGFGGGAGSLVGGGGGGGYSGGGGGSDGLGGSGGTSYVIPTAKSSSFSTPSSGEGSVEINYDPVADACTAVLIPSTNATVSGTTQTLDATASMGATAVQYEITGGALTDSLIATGTPTYYGWLAQWNTTSVPNGTYQLQSVAKYSSSRLVVASFSGYRDGEQCSPGDGGGASGRRRHALGSLAVLRCHRIIWGDGGAIPAHQWIPRESRDTQCHANHLRLACRLELDNGRQRYLQRREHRVLLRWG